MKFMNEWEIQTAVERFSDHEVLGRAAQFLSNFREEVNSHSDGWAYWKAPVQAAAKLMALFPANLNIYEHPPVTEQDFKRALAPIKSFYTRKGYAAGMSLPEIF